MILHKCKFPNAELMCVFLFQKMCLPILTYAFDVLIVSDNDLRRMEYVVNNAVKRIFGLYDNLNIAYVREITGVTSLFNVAKCRRSRFLFNLEVKNLTFREFGFRSYVRCDKWLAALEPSKWSHFNTNDIICNIRTALDS
jgi:hypothetical protein